MKPYLYFERNRLLMEATCIQRHDKFQREQPAILHKFRLL